MPSNILNDIGSPKTSVPHSTAVTGSLAPRIEVTVEPTYLIESTNAVHDTTVGTIASSRISPYALSEGTACNAIPQSALTKNTTAPTASDQKASVELGTLRMRDLLVMMI